jgi:hypothetical protein
VERHFPAGDVLCRLRGTKWHAVGLLVLAVEQAQNFAYWQARGRCTAAINRFSRPRSLSASISPGRLGGSAGEPKLVASADHQIRLGY